MQKVHVAWVLASMLACGSSGNGSSSGTASPSPVDGDGGSVTRSPTTAACLTAPADLAAGKVHATTCALGDDAPFFVRGAPFPNVVIEILPAASATPSQAATDHLVAVMKALLEKSGTITVVTDPPVPDVGHPLSLAEAATIEDRSRTRYSSGDTAVFFYFVANEASTDDTADAKILGYAYRPSSMIVFQKTIAAVAGGLGQPSRDVVESTVVAHEFGHILGLVNAGTPMQVPHEDTTHPKHDTNSACLMYWANNSSQGLANLLTGGAVPDFDSACLADIAALKR